MKHAFILAALAAAIPAAPVQAQPVAADLLPAYEVTTIIASMGMRPIGRPAWLRGRYIVAAIDRHGREVNVVLDARDGQVIAVRPLARDSFGAPPPPPGYPHRGAPYDPMDGRAPPPATGPGGPPPADDGEFFDNDQQQGSLPAPRPAARAASQPGDPAVTGSVPRSAPAARKDAATKDTAPMPRPRPALAKANDPGNKPAQAADKPAAAKPLSNKPLSNKPLSNKPVANKPEAVKPEAKAAASALSAKPDAKPEAEKKAEPAAKSEPATKTESAQREIRVIDLSKPKTTAKPDQKPGEAIRF